MIGLFIDLEVEEIKVFDCDGVLGILSFVVVMFVVGYVFIMGIIFVMMDFNMLVVYGLVWDWYWRGVLF